MNMLIMQKTNMGKVLNEVKHSVFEFTVVFVSVLEARTLSGGKVKHVVF